MPSSPSRPRQTVVIDAIHGDIHLSNRERRIIDTASFQRLRHLKQLGMGQATYPNATHTRFAHSLGVLAIMQRVCDVAREPLNLSEDDKTDLRLAGLLHDIGHYPYSHLMEGVDRVQLTEEFVEGGKTINASTRQYPDHVRLGRLIVTHQSDLIEAIGGAERAKTVAELFEGAPSGRERISKLIHSSLDMDRLDYLLRDARATGVPYGIIDLNYLLNNLRASSSGLVGVDDKALPAAEQFLFARFFMHRTVYHHKTTFGLEEACRQLLRRLRDEKVENLARDGDVVEKIAMGDALRGFTDAYVDRLVLDGSKHEDPVICSLADAILRRRPPKLLKEVPVLIESQTKHHAGTTFKQSIRHNLKALADEYNIPLGRFLVCETKPLKLEERGGHLTEDEARALQPEEKEELIKVFPRTGDEPVSIVAVDHSITRLCANHVFQSFRLYLVRDSNTTDDTIERLSFAVRDWDQATD